MPTSPLPPAGEPLNLRELAPGEELTVFRVVRSDDPKRPEFVDSFKSHAELGARPRGVEVSHPAIYRGISAFDRREVARETALRVQAAGHSIGDYVAALPLDRVEGAAYYYFWGARGHLTVWGDAIKLSQAAVDIFPIAVEEGSLIRGLHDSG
jgi:hypothetical protein